MLFHVATRFDLPRDAYRESLDHIKDLALYPLEERMLRMPLPKGIAREIENQMALGQSGAFVAGVGAG